MENKEYSHPTISIIVAMSPNLSIGYKGRLPWHIPEDLAHFKALTWGHTIIMGHNTYNSLPNGPLPGRRNIVLSKSIDEIKGCDVFKSLSESLKSCNNDDEVFIIGGASVYAEALPLADKIYLTLTDNDPRQADVFFPKVNMTEWKEIKKEKHTGFSFIEYCKIQKY